MTPHVKALRLENLHSAWEEAAKMTPNPKHLPPPPLPIRTQGSRSTKPRTNGKTWNDQPKTPGRGKAIQLGRKPTKPRLTGDITLDSLNAMKDRR